MTRLAHACLAHPRRTLLVWGVVVALLGLGALRVQHRLTPPNFVIPGSQSARSLNYELQHFGPRVTYPIMLRGPGHAIDRQGPGLVDALRREPGFMVLSPWDGAGLTPLRPRPDRAMLVLNVATSQSRAEAYVSRIEWIIRAHVRAPLSSYLTGQAAIVLGMQNAANQTTNLGLLIAAPVLLVVLLLVFRTPLAAAVPLIAAGGTVVGALGILDLLTYVMPLDFQAPTYASMTGLALGVDYSLLIVSRFREELGGGGRDDALKATATATSTAGRTVMFAGAVLVCAIAVAVLLLPQGLLLSATFGMAVSVVLAVFSALFVTPSVLVLLGSHLERWPLPWFGARPARVATIARRAMRRPVLIASALLTGLLIAAVPATALQPGVPGVGELPSANPARRDYQAVERSFGPGWGAPFELHVVARQGSVLAPATLTALSDFQRHLLRDRDVSVVMGIGDLLTQLRPLGQVPQQLDEVKSTLGSGRSGLQRLQLGLGRVKGGIAQLVGGLGAAASGAQRLQSGSGSAAAGSAQVTTGLDRAATGANQIAGGLQAAQDGSDQLLVGTVSARKGAARITAGLTTTEHRVSGGLPAIKGFAAQLARGSSDLGQLRAPAETVQTDLTNAVAHLRAMTVGKLDPRYATVLTEVGSAMAAATGRNPLTGAPVAAGYDGLAASLAQGEAGLTRAAQAVGVLSTETSDLRRGLSRLLGGERSLEQGLTHLDVGAIRLQVGLRRLAAAGGQLHTGLQALTTGANTLQQGTQRLSAGAATLAGGLSGGRAQSGALSSGVTTIDSAVGRELAQLPSARGLTQLQQQSPGMFRSGYFYLSAVDGASTSHRTLASTAVNLEHGGDAGQILVIARSGPNAPATAKLYRRLSRELRTLDRHAGLVGAVGGDGAQVADYNQFVINRLIVLILALSVVSYLALVIVLRSLVLPAFAVLLTLITAAATFGLLALLFQGAGAPAGGPGYIDGLSLIGIYTIIFGLTVDYQVFLITRMREGYSLTGTTSGAIQHGLERTARVIVGAAAILCATFLAFGASDFMTVREFGVGLAIAITLDASLVRLILLPTLMSLAGRWNWWLPSWLARRLPSVKVEDQGRPPASAGSPESYTLVSTREPSAAFAVDSTE